MLWPHYTRGTRGSDSASGDYSSLMLRFFRPAQHSINQFYQNKPRRLFSTIQNSLLKLFQHPQNLIVSFSSGEEISFSYQWLRESDPKTLHPLSKQRSVTSSLLTTDSYRPQHIQLNAQSNALQIEWADSSKSDYSSDWLLYQSKKRPAHDEVSGPSIRLWENNDSFNPATRPTPIIQYDKVDLSQLLEYLCDDGFVLVKGTPTDPQATIDLISLIGSPQSNNIWGSWWDYTVDTSKEEHGITDTAYTGDLIRPHSDGTYLYDTPGLQVFHVLQFEGDALPSTAIVDAFKVAQVIHDSDPQAYEFLSSFPFEWYFISDTHNVRTYKPVITLDATRQIEQIRFNDLDRAPPPPLPPDQHELYYRSVELFASLINQPKYQLKLFLEPGTVLIVNNWRVLHSRSVFKGKRRICGCYVAVDQFRSQRTMTSNWRPYV